MNKHASQTAPNPRQETCAPALPLWKTLLKEAVRDPAELCRYLGISTETVDLNSNFPMIVPEPFLKRIKKKDPMDPLLLQVLPKKEESMAREGFSTDPLDENQHLDPAGLLSKYQGRSLIVASRACGIACRFCFRRHLPFPKPGPNKAKEGFFVDPEAVAARLAACPEIHEVILSGGDPLMLSDSSLCNLIGCLDKVPSLQRIRIHTRLPVIIPQRITQDLARLLSNPGGMAPRPRRIVVLHINHSNELDKTVCRALEQLHLCGCHLLSQTVLLRRINDTFPVLKTLFEHLINSGVIPYYLHQLDRVAGAAHFEVPVQTGCQLMSKLRAGLPGYAVPRYVREIPGAPGKVSLM